MTIHEYRFIQLSSSKFNNIKFKVNVGAENCFELGQVEIMDSDFIFLGKSSFC